MITAYIDGGARGNPGPAGYGAYIVDDDGTVLAELFAPLGKATNNVAEYNGLLAALRWAIEHGVSRLHIRADSLLLVEQMRGNFRVKNARPAAAAPRRPAAGRPGRRRHLRARAARVEQGRRSAVEPGDGRERQGNSG